MPDPEWKIMIAAHQTVNRFITISKCEEILSRFYKYKLDIYILYEFREQLQIFQRLIN